MLDLLFSGIIYGHVIFLIALGLTLILGVLRVLNLAHSSLFLLGGYVVWYLSTYFKMNILIALLIGGLVTGAAGILIERGLRLLYGRAIEYQLLYTYAFVLILYDMHRTMFEPLVRAVPVPEAFLGTIKIFEWDLPKVGFLIIPVSAAFAIFLHLFIEKTRVGINVRAVSFDRETAAFLGINSKKVFVLIIFLETFLSGFGGGLAGMWIPMSPPSWSPLNVLAFSVLVMGGVGSIKGAYMASVVIGIIYSIGTFYFATLSTVFPVLIMAIFLLIRPKGLFGREAV